MIDGQQLVGACGPSHPGDNPGAIARVAALFFAEDDEPAAQAEAKAMCKECPVRSECLEIGVSEQFGIWGGKTTTERRGMRQIVREL